MIPRLRDGRFFQGLTNIFSPPFFAKMNEQFAIAIIFIIFTDVSAVKGFSLSCFHYYGLPDDIEKSAVRRERAFRCDADGIFS